MVVVSKLLLITTNLYIQLLNPYYLVLFVFASWRVCVTSAAFLYLFSLLNAVIHLL